jgi:hypothetical protein
MVQDFCDEPYDNMPYGTLLFYLATLPLTLGTCADVRRKAPLSPVYGCVGLTKETPEGSVFMLTAGKAPEGRPRGLEIPLHNHPGGVDLLITQRFFHHST